MITGWKHKNSQCEQQQLINEQHPKIHRLKLHSIHCAVENSIGSIKRDRQTDLDRELMGPVKRIV